MEEEIEISPTYTTYKHTKHLYSGPNKNKSSQDHNQFQLSQLYTFQSKHNNKSGGARKTMKHSGISSQTAPRVKI